MEDSLDFTPTPDTDLTTGSITRKLLAVAVPIMGSQLLQMAYNLTDMFWLGHTADAKVALAASGIGGMFMWLSMSLMMFGRMGAEIGVSQNLGRGDMAEAERYARAATQIALVLGLLFSAVMLIFTVPLISLFKIQEAPVRDAAALYLRIAAIGIPMTYITASVTGAFNGAGNTRLSFTCNLIGMAVNVVLDPLMIYVFGWGVAGAAISTVIGQATVCVLFMICMKRHGDRPFPGFRFRGRIHREISAQIVRWAWPVALESGAFTMLAMVVTSMVTEYSATAITVQRIGSQIESLSWLIGGGFGTAVTAFVGQNYGARKFDRIHSGFRISMMWLLCWQAIVTLVLFFFGAPLFWVFIKDATIQSMGSVYLKILSACTIFGALEGVCSGTFRGTGRTAPPSICGIASNLIRPLLCYLLLQRMGLNGLWWGISLSAAIRGISVGIWYLVAYHKAPLESAA